MSKSITLHIGAPKTGTTSIQQFCHDHAAVLARHGLVFPTQADEPALGPTVNHILFDFALTGENARRFDMSRREAQRILSEAISRMLSAPGASQVLLSCENLYNSHATADARFLRKMTAGAGTRVIAYARRLDDWSESLYCQFVWGRVQPAQKVTSTRPIPTIEETRHLRDLPRRTISSVIGRYAKMLPEAETVVRSFAREARSGRLVANFLEILGLDAGAILAETAPERRMNDARPEVLTMLLWHLQRAAMPIPDCFQISRAGLRKARVEGGVPGFEGRRFRFMSEADARRAFDLYQTDAAKFEALACDRDLAFQPPGGVDRALTPEDAERLIGWLEPALPPGLADAARARLMRVLPA